MTLSKSDDTRMTFEQFLAECREEIKHYADEFFGAPIEVTPENPHWREYYELRVRPDHTVAAFVHACREDRHDD